MAQLYGCDAENGLWIVPGSHRLGKVDIVAMVEAAGCDRLADAVPLLCNAGDVAICNRQAVHGSFANTSDQPRVTLNFGFHRRASVLGVRSGGVHNQVTEYDDARIRERSKMIMLRDRCTRSALSRRALFRIRATECVEGIGCVSMQPHERISKITTCWIWGSDMTDKVVEAAGEMPFLSAREAVDGFNTLNAYWERVFQIAADQARFAMEDGMTTVAAIAKAASPLDVAREHVARRARTHRYGRATDARSQS